jgi:hypothetical protein
MLLNYAFIDVLPGKNKTGQDQFQGFHKEDRCAENI